MVHLILPMYVWQTIITCYPSGLQGAIDIVAHDAKRIHLTFNAAKTGITVTGSKQDMEFYQNTSPWHLNGERLNVVDNNEHLGLVISEYDAEQKKM